jgi:hypothetical protein
MELPEQDRQALIEAARRRGQGGAAFGVYPSSGKRPEKLNVSRDVNMPAQTARGWVAGTLGLPGDIEGLGRMLINMAPAGQEHERVTGKSFVSETPFLPTSDFYREWLPGGDERPAAQFASGLGALAGGAGSTKVAGAAVKGAKAVGKTIAPKVDRKAEGGLVQDTDAIVAQLKGMDKDKALTHALRMANAKQEAHMAAGGLAKLLKGAKKAEDAAKAAKPAAPAIMPPVAPMTKDQMRPIAQRVANQMTGEFVRPDPKFSINPAGKSQKVFQRERDLPVEVTQRIPQKPAETIDIEKYEGYGLVGVPGDPTLGGVAKPGTLSQIHEGAAELKRLGDVEFESPVQLFGGPRYGAYNPGEEFWASNIGPARTLQNRVTSTSEALDAPVLGQYIKMSPESTNFALHNLDALLSYMQPEKLGKKSLQELNDEIRKGSPKLGKFPGFAGFEDPIDVLLQSQMHSDLRKHIAETLMKPTVAKKFGLRPGSDVLFGISEPKLRELEAGISGYSVGQMKPGAELTPSLHPTYDYDIPGTFIGQSKYPTPYEIAFPASTAYTRSQLKPGVQEFNMLKMVGPREKIDPQYIDQIKMYEELMKEYTGKKKGGLVKKSGLSVLNKAII